jgi:hypothetical protein
LTTMLAAYAGVIPRLVKNNEVKTIKVKKKRVIVRFVNIMRLPSMEI